MILNFERGLEVIVEKEIDEWKKSVRYNSEWF